MVHSIKDLIVALICVAMLNVAAANAQTATAQDLPVTGGKLTSTQTSFQQPGSTSLSVEQSPLKLGSTSTEADQVPAHIQEMPEFKTTVVYLGTLPLLSVSGGESAPLERASIISSKVNQLQWDHTPGSDIGVRFDGKHYTIVAGKDQELLTIDQGVRISTSQALSEKATALQIANRLRRHFGNAPELSDSDQPSSSLAAQPAANFLDALGGTVVHAFQGLASWYGNTFLNRRTSSGAVLRQDSLLAAHRALPFGTLIRVTNLSNGKQVTVKVLDRGPFVSGRVLDLSPRAAQVLGMISAGVARVKVEVLR